MLDPPAALNHLLAQTDRESHRLVQEMLDLWARESPEAAFQWALEGGPDERHKFLSAAMQGMARADVETAASLAFGLEDSRARSRALANVLSIWVGQDPTSALRWFSGLSDTELRRSAIAGMARNYSRLDPHAAYEWASTLPADEARVALPDVLHSMAYRGQHQEALTHVVEMTDQQAQTRAGQMVVSEWAKVDAKAAYDWVSKQQSGLRRERWSSSVILAWSMTDRLSLYEHLESIKDPAEHDHFAALAERMLYGDALERAYYRVSDADLKARLARRLYSQLERADPARAEVFRVSAGIEENAR